MDHRVRLAGCLTAALLLGATSTAVAAAPQETAILKANTVAFAGPSADAKPAEAVSKTRPITGEETTLPVIARATDAAGAAWLKVLLPGRPNSHSGWIAQGSATQSVTKWRITIHTARRTVTVFRIGRPARTFRTVVGKPSTPTPPGRFFVEETVRLRAGDVGAPYALALSARSNVLQEFEGGPGQIALHGTDNVGGTPGTAASHGCLRLDTKAISWIAARIGPGVPVTIGR